MAKDFQIAGASGFLSEAGPGTERIPDDFSGAGALRRLVLTGCGTDPSESGCVALLHSALYSRVENQHWKLNSYALINVGWASFYFLMYLNGSIKSPCPSW